MINRVEIYKASKHKNNSTANLTTNFTSTTIQNQNVYDLNHALVSQLVQDLIRNDVSIKSKRSTQRREHSYDDYSQYFVGNKFILTMASSSFLKKNILFMIFSYIKLFVNTPVKREKIVCKNVINPPI